MPYCSLFRSFALTLWLFTVAPFSGLQAQHRAPETTRIFQATEFYEEQGLISNSVYQISQDSSKLLWFLTNKGIATFDGLNWNAFSSKLRLPNTRNSLIQRAGNAMIVAGEHGREIRLGIYRNKRWRFIPPPEINHSFRALNIAIAEQDGQLTIAFNSRNEIYLLQPSFSSWKKYVLPELFGEANPVHNLQFFRKKLWLSTEKGLYTFNSETQEVKKIALPASLPQNILRSKPDPQHNRLMILGTSWLGEVNDSGFQLLASDDQPEDQKNSIITHSNLLIDQSGNFVVSRNFALSHQNSDSSIAPFFFKLNDAERIDAYTCVFQDKTGNYWFASERGIKKVNSLAAANFNASNGLAEDEVSAILPLSDNRILLGGNYSQAMLKAGKLTILEKEKNHRYIGDIRILDGCETSDHRVYLAGNRKGIGQLSRDGNISWAPLPEDQWAISVHPAPDGKGVWVGTARGKLLAYQPEKGFSLIYDYPPAYIRKIITTADKRIFLLSNIGLIEIDAKGKEITRIEGSDQIYNLYDLEKFRGQFILATGKGLAILEDTTLRLFNIQLDRPVFALEKTDSSLWMGTDNGLYTLKGQNLFHLSLEDGLLGREVNRAAFTYLPNGEFWVGTDRGLAVIDTKNFMLHDRHPETFLTEYTAGNSLLYHHSQSALVPANASSLEFGFKSILFHHPSSLQYRYRLQGLESEWQYITNPHQNLVRYPHLPPGNYQFELQSRGYNTGWGKVLKSGAITIAQPFYLSPGFLISLLLSIVFLVYLIFSLILSKRNALKLQEAIESKRNEIASSEERFRRLWEAADMGMALVQTNGQILMSNSGLQHMLASKYIAGKRINSLIPSTLLSEAELQQVQTQSELKRKELSLHLNGTKRHFLLTLSPVFQANQNCILVMLKEVSELKQVQEENQKLTQQLLVQNHDLKQQEEGLRKSNEALLEQRTELQRTLKDLEERNFELDQLVYKTSHDLRAPISSTLGLLNIMKIEADPNAIEHYIELAIQALNKQDAFIKSMLSFSRATRIQNPYLAIDFREVIQCCLDELQFVPGFDTVNIQHEILHEHIPFVGDPQKLKIIFANLISNSIKYRDRQKQSSLSIFISLNKEKADIHFIDNGIGIDPAYLPKVFDMFYRATEDANGSGLGLYIVKQTIEKMNGSIAVKSVLREGTEFIIHLPNAVPKERKQASSASVASKEGSA